MQSSVEHIKKIHEKSEKAEDKKASSVAAVWAGKTTGPIDLLQRYSDILTNAFMALQYCPFQNTVPLSLQTCLSMSQKILDSLEALEKKEWTYEKISTTVIEFSFGFVKYTGLGSGIVDVLHIIVFSPGFGCCITKCQ